MEKRDMRAESPMDALELVDHARRRLSPVLEEVSRAELGQYLTPAPVASFMAQLFDELPLQVRLLDAGAGIGSLTAAFVEEACRRENRPTSIFATAYEVDGDLVSMLMVTLDVCRDRCRQAGIDFNYELIRDDFIINLSEPVITAWGTSAKINCAILNPPYGKIASQSAQRRALRRHSIETGNLYSAFVALAIEQLADGGQLVAITPRSFCNGPYFASFRRRMLQLTELKHIHVYESRRKAFADDSVLQENIIFKLRKGVEQGATVRISASDGPADDGGSSRDVPFDEVVVPGDSQQFIRLPVTEGNSMLAARVAALPARLADLGVAVSTGRVVDFRAVHHLRSDPGHDTVPLLYPSHMSGAKVVWPKIGGKKDNAILLNEVTLPLLVPRGTYVLTKRFTSKEERRRIVAAIFDPRTIDAEYLGFENHLNYFHSAGSGLDETLARGLATYLNSTAVDNFFRQFSGHTQVNAGDLRNLHYPSRDQLVTLGRRNPTGDFEQAFVDHLVVGVV